MKQTRFGRITATLMGEGSSPNAQPAQVCRASKRCAARVVVRNVSFAQTIWLAVDSVQSLLSIGVEGPGGDTFELPPGTSETVVLAPEQILYSAATGPQGILTFMISDALLPDFGDERRLAP